MIRLALAFSILAGPAWGQTLVHPPHDAAHPLAKWRSKSGLLCCDSTDCAMADGCSTSTGPGWLEDGKCHALPLDAEQDHPDWLRFDKGGQVFVCGPKYLQSRIVRCWVPERST